MRFMIIFHSCYVKWNLLLTVCFHLFEIQFVFLVWPNLTISTYKTTYIVLIELLLQHYQVNLINVFGNGLHVFTLQTEPFQSKSIRWHSCHKPLKTSNKNLNTLVKHETKVGFKDYMSKTNWMTSNKNKNPFPYDICFTNHTSQPI